MTNKKRNPTISRAAPSVEIDPPYLNWPQVIADLIAAGCSKYRIASHLGVGTSTVQSWQKLSGSGDIRYGFGRALLRLHSHYCGSALTFRRITEGDQRTYTSAA